MMGKDYFMKGNRGKKRGMFKGKANADRKIIPVSERKDKGSGRSPKEILK